MKTKRPKLCIVCSGGGHLIEALIETYTLRLPKFFVTFYSPHLDFLLKDEIHYYIINPYRNPVRFVKTFWQSLRIFLKEKPDVIFSSGASIAIPMYLIGKVFGLLLIFAESPACTENPSATGRFLYPFCDLFIVPWPHLLKYYKRASYFGDFLQ